MRDEMLKTAIVYDFDGTLAPGNIQEHSLIPQVLGMSPADFWGEVSEEARKEDADSILTYLRLILEKAEARGIHITRELLAQHGASTPFFAGVPQFFERINRYAEERGLLLEHYVVSSGNEEMIRACRIAHAFKRIFACRYHYDGEGIARSAAVAINYTSKTQFLFRINKGIDNHWDDRAVNAWIPPEERPLPFSRMIYLGDGDTDIPSMKMVRHQGGFSIAVFDPIRWARLEQQEKVYKLIAEDRAHFVVPADYTEGSQLDITIKGLIGRIARDQAGYRGGS